MSIVETKTVVNSFLDTKLEYKRQNLWVLEYEGLPSYLVQSAGRPNLQIDNGIKVKFLTTYQNYSGNTATWQPMDFVINDSITPSGSRMFYELLLKQWNYSTARVGAKSQYAGALRIKLLSPDTGSSGKVSGMGGSSSTPDVIHYQNHKTQAWDANVLETWKLNNAFLSAVNFNGNPLDYENSDRLKINFTVTYDWAELEEVNEQGR